ncbi:unnamed protein product [Citrullus colocynthis]|uniref:peroxidase n=1 Tax=Citrullus colocynthis TaxID=252529 RepID=A0ABP0Z4U9_9ROSI
MIGEQNAAPDRNSARGYGVIHKAKTEVEKKCPGVVSCADILAVAARDASFAVIKLGRRDSTTGSKTLAENELPHFQTGLERLISIFADKGFAKTRRRNCPTSGGNGNLAPLDLVTPNSFDNYFKNLIQRKGLLENDQVLFNGGSTDNIVREYSRDLTIFKSDFTTEIVKMRDIQPLTGLEGQIRNICGAVI